MTKVVNPLVFLRKNSYLCHYIFKKINYRRKTIEKTIKYTRYETLKSSFIRMLPYFG